MFPTTVVCTPFKSFKFLTCHSDLRMQQSLSSKSSVKLICGLLFVFADINDILVRSSSEEHKHHLTLLLERLSKYTVKINPSKCVFGVSSLKFGTPNWQFQHCLIPEKIKAILKLFPPSSIYQLWQFLVMVNFLRSVSHYTEKLSKLTQILKIFLFSFHHHSFGHFMVSRQN